MESPTRRDDTHDPFKVFDASSGVGHVRDPYPTFAELREHTPVYEGRFDKVFNLPAMPTIMGGPDSRFFVALSYDAVPQVLLDGETFSSTGYADTIGLVMGHSILEMDEPEHRRYRSLHPAGVHAEGDGALGARHRRARSSTRCIDRFAERGQRRPGARADLAVPHPGDRRDARPAGGGSAGVPPPGGRADHHRGRHRARLRGVAEAARLLRRHARRAPRRIRATT